MVTTPCLCVHWYPSMISCRVEAWEGGREGGRGFLETRWRARTRMPKLMLPPSLPYLMRSRHKRETVHVVELFADILPERVPGAPVNRGNKCREGGREKG